MAAMEERLASALGGDALMELLSDTSAQIEGVDLQSGHVHVRRPYSLDDEETTRVPVDKDALCDFVQATRAEWTEKGQGQDFWVPRRVDDVIEEENITGRPLARLLVSQLRLYDLFKPARHGALRSGEIESIMPWGDVFYVKMRGSGEEVALGSIEEKRRLDQFIALTMDIWNITDDGFVVKPTRAASCSFYDFAHMCLSHAYLQERVTAMEKAARSLQKKVDLIAARLFQCEEAEQGPPTA